MAVGRERQVTGSELKHSELSRVNECEVQESWASSLEVKGIIMTHSQPLALKHLISLTSPSPGLFQNPKPSVLLNSSLLVTHYVITFRIHSLMSLTYFAFVAPEK